MRLKICIAAATIFSIMPVVSAQGHSAPAVITVDASHPGAEIPSTLFGAFFEDINFGADGGLYPERIKNRSFEFDEPLTGWKALMSLDANLGVQNGKGELSIRTDDPLNVSNPHYLRVGVYEPGYGFWNSGFRGIGVEQGAEYRFSAYIRTKGPKALRATITDGSGRELGTGKLDGFSSGWKRYETVIRATGTEAHAQFNIFIDEPGTVDFDMVSLYPVDTFKGRPNGLRKDLGQLLADMHPGFLRFPGGCIVEGRRLANRYQWKLTVGDVSKRKTLMNRWNNEFENRAAPDYFQSFGLGFYEYFQLAEDIGASPLPILNCGMACEFNSSETARLEDLHEYIQDALDLIEFANGSPATPWGKLRAEMGHPAPFHMTMLGVGNEQWGPRYVERYKPFAQALKQQHPEIKLVVSVGPAPSGKEFDEMWGHWRELHPDIVDEHYYMSPEWFLENSGRYDNYDRKGPRIFAGEYAAQTAGVARDDNRNNWRTALSEAAYMTGLERNADVVQMASYAPLLAHVDAWQWRPDAIWFDNLRSFGSTDYQVQRIFAGNLGTRIVPSTPHSEAGLYTSASLDERTHELILKTVNVSSNDRAAEIRLTGVQTNGAARVTTLAAADLLAENTMEHPDNVVPVGSTLDVHSANIPVQLRANSVTVFRIPVQ